MNRPGPATPQHRSSTETPGAIPACRASARISVARMKLSCSTNSPRGYADMRARRSALKNGARSSCFMRARTYGDGRTYTAAMSSRGATPAAAVLPVPAYREHWMRAVRPTLVTGAIVQLPLLAVLAGIAALSGVGLSPAGWAVGLTCGVVANAAVERGLAHCGADRLRPADWVTLARATLAIGVAALVADSFDRAVPGALLVSVAAIALTLDAVDGWVARRTRTAAMFGAHFDGEVDAFLILVLSVYA